MDVCLIPGPNPKVSMSHMSSAVIEKVYAAGASYYSHELFFSNSQCSRKVVTLFVIVSSGQCLLFSVCFLLYLCKMTYDQNSRHCLDSYDLEVASLLVPLIFFCTTQIATSGWRGKVGGLRTTLGHGRTNRRTWQKICFWKDTGFNNHDCY